MVNPLVLTDSYKMHHQEMYPEGTEYIYSYFEARRPDLRVLMFGLYYYLTNFLNQRITKEHVEEVLDVRKSIVGSVPAKVVAQYRELERMGYFPLSIRAVPEGMIVPTQTPLFSVINTVPGFGWCGGYLESLLLKLWNTCSVATTSAKYRVLVEKYGQETCDDLSHIPFSTHDFGYRGTSSEETAVLSGMAHLLSFIGTDNVPAVHGAMVHYGAHGLVGASVPASEHSVMCAYLRHGELNAFSSILDIYPEGIVSIVSDTYDYFEVLTTIIPQLKDRILGRNGKVVIRPDSGDPYKILLGDPESSDLREQKGTFELLWEMFGGTVNSKGYRVLNDKIGVIYGDGMYYKRFEQILQGMKDAGFASSNLVIGIGGLLLQNHGRDDLAFALKASAIQVNGEMHAIAKDPKTAAGKKSKAGVQRVDWLRETRDVRVTSHIGEGTPLKTLLDVDDNVNAHSSLLIQQYRFDPSMKKPYINYTNFSEIRERVEEDLKHSYTRLKLSEYERPVWS